MLRLLLHLKEVRYTSIHWPPVLPLTKLRRLWRLKSISRKTKKLMLFEMSVMMRLCQSPILLPLKCLSWLTQYRMLLGNLNFQRRWWLEMANGLYKTWELFSVKGREIGIHCGLILRKIELEYQNNKTV